MSKKFDQEAQKAAERIQSVASRVDGVGYQHRYRYDADWYI